MRISWKWLGELVDLSGVDGPEGLARLLTERGLEVEELRPLSRGFDKVVTAQILERAQHPQADRLSLCKVTTGAGEPLEIVCGAQNMKAGDKVALAQVGAHLPNGVKIERSKIRGVVSNGMLCSEKELGLSDESEGIIILPAGAPLGKPLAEYLGRDDTILSFKLTANRGDCLSHFGMAREVAAALGRKARRPEGKALDLKTPSPVSIHLGAGDACPQFWGVLIDGVKVGPSPEWLVKRLDALGSRSINNVVDATNLLLFELGQPVHAYDADRIEGGEIRVRLARAGETVPLLDGQTVELGGSELVIADGKRAVGLAGVMGGGNSEVQAGTKRVFLECAEFAPSLVRRASTRHQRKTEAAHRFERGVDPAGVRPAMARLVRLVTELAGGTVRGASVAALPSREASKDLAQALRKTIRVNPAYFAEFLGMPVAADQARRALESHECEVRKEGEAWVVLPPTYRPDLAIPEDLAEEIARSVGYDKVPSTLPRLTSKPTVQVEEPASARLMLIDRAKDALARAGLLESVNFAFSNGQWLRRFGLEPTVRVLNPLSEEHEWLVPSLVPGLVRNALDNWRHHFGSEALALRLFELRPTFHLPGGPAPADGIAARGEMETGVEERWKVAIALSGPRFAGGLRQDQGEVDFYDLKAAVETLFEALGTRGVRYQPLAQSKLLHPGQSVEILTGNTVAGVMGLLHPGLARELKARGPVWLAELDLDAVLKLSRPAFEPRAFRAWPEFPPMERDFALVVGENVTADKITQVALKAGKPLAKVAKVFDIYRGAQVPQGMTSVAVRVIFFDEGRSLQESEAETASSKILEAWKKDLGAELRS
jgi:phenylalanyl-tRNA synthetase beta chain